MVSTRPASQSFRCRLYNVPDILSSVAEFATGDTGAEAEVADTDRVVLESVGKVVDPFGHSADEDAYALLGAQICNVILDSDNVGIITQGDLSAVWRKMIGDGVLDDLEKLLL